MQLGRFGQTAPFAAFLHGTLEGLARPPLPPFPPLPSWRWRLGGGEPLPPALLLGIDGKRWQTPDWWATSRQLGHRGAALAVTAMAATRSVMANRAGTLAVRPNGGQYGVSAWEHRVR